MADLSPAAQAVLDSVRYRMCAGESEDYAAGIAAAALRAAADQVVPPDPCGNDCCITQYDQIRCELLTLAAELESQ